MLEYYDYSLAVERYLDLRGYCMDNYNPSQYTTCMTSLIFQHVRIRIEFYDYVDGQSHFA